VKNVDTALYATNQRRWPAAEKVRFFAPADAREEVLEVPQLQAPAAFVRRGVNRVALLPDLKNRIATLTSSSSPAM
jgi:hypothetical protein